MISSIFRIIRTVSEANEAGMVVKSGVLKECINLFCYLLPFEA